MSANYDPNIMAINIMGAIPKGARLLKWRARDDIFVVFCEWREEYVSWLYSPGARGVDHGRYSRDYSHALATFNAR